MSRDGRLIDRVDPGEQTRDFLLAEYIVGPGGCDVCEFTSNSDPRCGVVFASKRDISAPAPAAAPAISADCSDWGAEIDAAYRTVVSTATLRAETVLDAIRGAFGQAVPQAA